jgi:transposase-like protein
MNETTTTDRRPSYNSSLAKKQHQWLIEHSTSHQILWCFDSLVFRIRFFAKPQTVNGQLKTKNPIERQYQKI